MLMLEPLPIDRSAADATISVITFIAHVGFDTRTCVRLLGPCFKTGRIHTHIHATRRAYIYIYTYIYIYDNTCKFLKIDQQRTITPSTARWDRSLIHHVWFYVHIHMHIFKAVSRMLSSHMYNYIHNPISDWFLTHLIHRRPCPKTSPGGGVTKWRPLALTWSCIYTHMHIYVYAILCIQLHVYIYIYMCVHVYVDVYILLQDLSTPPAHAYVHTQLHI